MNIAIIKQTLCINTAVFPALSMAQQFLDRGMWDADDVQALPEGYGIGDSYIDGEWIKAPQPEQPEPPEPLEPILSAEEMWAAFMEGYSSEDDE